MKYGEFNDKNKEYVIKTPETPLPWINYLGNENFFSLISNTCGGYSFYKDAKLMRITRFRYNSIPMDEGGKYYYIKDGDTIFNPGFMPSKTNLDFYTCRVGLGYSIFNSTKNNIKTELTCFVPLKDACEINQLKIKNDSNDLKSIQIYSFVEWCLWNTVDDSTNFQRNLNIAEVEVENNTIYHKTEYRERRNHYAFYNVNTEINGFDTDRDSFLGKFRGLDSPLSIEKGISNNSIASGWSPIASHRIDITLNPGEEKTLIFILGYVENDENNKFYKKNVINKDRAYVLINKYNSIENVNNAFNELKHYWNILLSKLNVNCGNEKINRMLNIWNQYQCMVTFNMSRSASYFESGTGRGMGFRDSCQDLLGFVHLIPERTRQRIIDIASIQFEDGSTYHQYQPLTKKGNSDAGVGFNDDPLWLIAATSAYLKETGDSSILFEQVPFNNQSGSEKDLLEHLRRSVNYTITHKGPHGLPLIGRADWNDCLNLNCFSKTPGESFQTVANYESNCAESVFIAAMFVKYGREFATICQLYGDSNEAEQIIKEVKLMENSVIKYGWDGNWYLRAYDAHLNKIGSKECDEGKIFVEPQGFCIMAKIGGKEYYNKSLSSVKKYLENDYGIEILNPCYTEYHIELGEISSYPPGYKENGSVFCHNNPWIILAYIENGNYNEAYDLYKKNCPAFIENISDIHKTESYVYSQTIAGRDAKNYGEAKNSWLTGTASWMMVALSQGLLGIIPDYNGLRIEPHLPDAFKEISIVREFRGTTYNIKVIKDNPTETYLVLNGQKIMGNLIPIIDAHSCDVTLHII